MTLTREDYVTKSVMKYLREALVAKGYTDDTVELIDSFPTEGLDTPLKKTFVAAGFNFDDGGKQAECGSTLKFRLYTIEFFIFGNTRTWAKNVANAVKFSLENDQIVPLVDIIDPLMPQIDAMPVIACSAEHQPVKDPAPWEEHVWTVHLRVEDAYLAADAVA